MEVMVFAFVRPYSTVEYAAVRHATYWHSLALHSAKQYLFSVLGVQGEKKMGL